jgi:type III secretion protein J
MMHYQFRFIAIVLCFLFLSACQVELYRDLSESEANEMASILIRNNIKATKTVDKEKLVMLTVDEKYFAKSVDLLKARGYPQTVYAGADVYLKKDGMVSSPTEEWARVVYARSQELAKTISEIDGVLLSRVHIAIPKKVSLIDVVEDPTASVFIKYLENSDVEVLLPQIKFLVANSIEGLEYDKVSVLLTPESNSYSLEVLNNKKSLAKEEMSRKRLMSKIFFYIRMFLAVVFLGIGYMIYTGLFEKIVRKIFKKEKKA